MKAGLKNWERAKPVRLDSLRAGDKVIVDGGFTCMPPFATRTVAKIALRTTRAGTSKYIRCNDGKHFLDGQCDHVDPKKPLVGVRKVKA